MTLSQKQQAQLRGYLVSTETWQARFDRYRQEADRLRFEAFRRGDAELHRAADEVVFLMMREGRT